jgi:hypothetical protein
MVNLHAAANALWIEVATISSPAVAENPNRAKSTCSIHLPVSESHSGAQHPESRPHTGFLRQVCVGLFPLQGERDEDKFFLCLSPAMEQIVGV